MVSIIVPIYNSEKFLFECVQSVVRQSYQNIEVILVDDGSTDKSGIICDRLAAKDNRIKVIHQENSGAGAARNTGIKQARGEYIQFVDSDDTLSPEITETLIKGIKQIKNGMSVCSIDMQTAYQKEEWKKVQPYQVDGPLSIKDYLYQLSKYKSGVFFGSPDNKLYITEILRTNSIYFEEREHIGEDFIFNMKYLMYIEEIYIFSNCLYHYRYNNVSLSNQSYNTKKVWARQKLMYKSFLDIMTKRGNYRRDQKEITGFLMSAIKTVFVNIGVSKSTFNQDRKQIKEIVNDKICNDIIFCNKWKNKEWLIYYCIKKRYIFTIWLICKLGGKMKYASFKGK